MGSRKPLFWLRRVDTYIYSNGSKQKNLGKCGIVFLCENAAARGDFKVLKWLKESDTYNRIKFGQNTWISAAKSGDFDMLKWIISKNRNKYTQLRVTCEAALMGGHMEILKYLEETNDFKCVKSDLWDYLRTQRASYKAAESGNIEVMKWVRKMGADWSAVTCHVAAFRGHLELLKWLHENGCPWNDKTCECAAHGGHMEVLQWAINNGCPWGAGTCAGAAQGGHLNILKWARENGCEWDWRACGWAANWGHLETLKWAYENGCARIGPWGCPLESHAASSGNLEMVKWLKNLGGKWDGYSVCSVAAYSGHVHILKWALENGDEWNFEIHLGEYNHQRAQKKGGKHLEIYELAVKMKSKKERENQISKK